MARRFVPRSCAIRSLLTSLVIVGLAACGGSDPKPTDFKIRATVTGLTDGNSVVLQVTDAGSSASVDHNGIVDLLYGSTGAKYHVTVKTPPSNPPETCTVSHGEGSIGTSDVTDVLVTCSEKTFNISVSVSGLLGSGLSICENYTDANCASAVPISPKDTTVIRSSLADGVSYLLVFAGGQPTNPWQSCSFTSGSADGTKAGGTIKGADVVVAVSCTTKKYAITGTISGLAGSGLELSMAGQDHVTPGPIASSFAFAGQLDSGAPFTISIAAQPTNLWQTCLFDGATGDRTSITGTVQGADVSVSITCTANPYFLKGTIAGLAGSGLTLSAIGQTVGPVAGANSFTFPKPVSSGSSYEVSVSAQPTNPWQTCLFTDGSSDGTKSVGIIKGADAVVPVVCTTNTYAIAGTIAGLTGTGLKLTMAGQDDVKPLPGAVSFGFSRKVDSGSAYGISVTGQPTNPSQNCTVTSGSGTVGGQDTKAVVTCTTVPYAVGVTVSQLRSSVVLTLTNQTDQTSQDLTLSSGMASAQFAYKLASGSKYQIAVKTQPSSPKQQCSVMPGTGVIGNADVTATVTCQSYHQVSGKVIGTQGAAFGVTLTSDASSVSTATTVDSSGYYSFANVLDGGYTISASLTSWVISPQALGVTLTWNGSDGVGLNFTAIKQACVGNWCVMNPMPAGSLFESISGTSASDVWVFTPNFTLSHWNGASWTSAATSNSPSFSYSRIWADAPGDVWAFGSPMLERWNGSRVTITGSGGPWSDAWGFSSTDIWFVYNYAMHWNGSSFSTPESLGAYFNGVWGSDTGDIWAVGPANIARHRTAGSWATVSSGTTNQLGGIWGSAYNDVWAVGAAGTIVHWDGNQWSPSPYSGITTTKGLSRVWGGGKDAVWAVGAGGTIIHWDGTSWTSENSGTSVDLVGLWGAGSNDVWAVGGNTILRRQAP